MKSPARQNKNVAQREGNSSPGKKWIRVDVSCEDRVAEDLGAFVSELFGVGIEVVEQGIRFYLDGLHPPDDWESRLHQLLSHPVLPGPGSESPVFSFHDVPDEDWGDRWKEHFKPLRVGRRLVISPTWEAFEGAPEDLVIRIDPGRAFGTGHHETTRLCMEWLEDLAASGEGFRARSMLDVGTGSGILAIAAFLLGFPSVVGIDNDPEAIEVARENVVLNHAARGIRLVPGTIEELDRPYDIVLANIQAQPLIRMAPAMERRVGRRGRLALGGILLEQLDEVRHAYSKEGLTNVETRTAGEWGLLVFER